MTPAVRVLPLGGLGEIGKNMTIVECEGRNVDESDDVRSVRAKGGDDLASVRVSDDERGTILEGEYLAEPRDVVG